MGVKVKKSQKPVTNTQKKHSNVKKSPALSIQKGSSVHVGAKKTEINQCSPKKASNHVAPAPTKTVITLDPSKTSKCELLTSSVEAAVIAAFKAWSCTLQKTKTGQLFEDDPHPINLLVSAIKISSSDSQPLRVKLPNPFLNGDCDICLIVKDLEKGWKVDHEPTTQYYQELLDSKNVSFITEVMPLRQLRVEFKPYEARGKFAKRFDAMFVDKRIAKFVPRYLGKSFYQAGKLPVSVDLEADDLLTEINQALSISMMSMSNNGTSTQMQIGLSNQTEKEIVENIMAVYQSMQKHFPGKFANIRSLCIRFGSHPWTVPIYVSFATLDTVSLPISKKHTEPLIDDLSTLAPGWKVAVYPSGEVKKIPDVEYQRTDLDAEIEDLEAPENNLEDEDMSDTEAEEKLTVARTSKKTRKAEVSDVEEGESENMLKTSKEKKSADESSEDEGDALEEQYMNELDTLEGELLGEQDKEETEPGEPEKVELKPQKTKKKVFKKSIAKKKEKH
ncbi:ribosomal L1 domain-containing protein CG13096-like [Daphnia carinata]|uniref:ribosomal L1 domain-containing protein CG13096-like n=1 Tax=Daphnia carinata TaxID=120202 RepID=UPI00257F8BF1|nr:ribosomal L1 domain-containing protein CG13096-like [Daphnia carinata]